MPAEYQTNSSTINIKKQVGRLLAFIILFQKKIEQIRVKLAGNQQFHTKLAFSLIDVKKKNKLFSTDILEFINKYGHSPITQAHAQLFCRKYSSYENGLTNNYTQTVNGVYSLSSHQFFKYLSPRTNKSLTNSLLLRVQPKSCLALPLSLQKLFTQLLSTSILMLSTLQSIKFHIHESNQLTFIQIIQTIKRHTKSSRNLYNFICQSEGQEYDFIENDLIYLTYHLKNNKCEEIQDMSDEDIRELMLPIDIGKYKNKIYDGGRYGDTQQQQNGFSKTNYFLPSTNPYFYENNDKLNEAKKMSTTSINFLNVNYKQTSKNFYKQQPKAQLPRPPRIQTQTQLQFEQGVKTKVPTAMIINSYSKNYQNHSFKQPQHHPPTSNLQQTILSNSIFTNTNYQINRNSYNNNPNINSSISQNNNGVFMIQKFTKKDNSKYYLHDNNKNDSSLASSIRSNRRNIFKENIEKFQDDYNNRSEISQDNSRNSAFVQY